MSRITFYLAVGLPLPITYSSVASMANPYALSESALDEPDRQHVIAPFLLGAAVALVFATVTSIPGLVLLNQSHGWIPTQAGFFEIEVWGKPVSNSSAIRYSVTAGIGFAVIALRLFDRAWHVWRGNRRPDPVRT